MNQIIKYNGTNFKIKKRRGLLTLNLSKKGIMDISEIENLEHVRDLQVLKLNDNEITEIKGLESLTLLKVLDLGHNKITEIKGLENLINLEKLNLEYNEIEIIQGLDPLKKLSIVRFGGNKISKVESLKNKENLPYLILDGSSPLYHKIDRIFGVVNSNNLVAFSQMSQAEKEQREKEAWEEIFRQESLKGQQVKKMIGPKIKHSLNYGPIGDMLGYCLVVIILLIIVIIIILMAGFIPV